jgi:hypothetical protein
VIGSRSQFSSVQLAVRNAVDSRWFENRYPVVIRMLGRSSTFTLRNVYHATPQDRDIFEALTKQTASLEFNNGTHTLQMDFKGSNVLNTLEDDLPLDRIYEQTLTLQNYWDPTSATDFQLNFT